MSNYKLYQGDCLQMMKDVEDESVDLILTDPPYLMDYQSHRRKQVYDKITGDTKDTGKQLIHDFLEESYRVLKDDTAIYMFCSWHHIDFFKQEFEQFFNLKNIIIWNKNNHGSDDLKGSYAPKYEMVLYGHKGRSLFRDKRIPDVIDCAKVSGSVSKHPTEKPVDLLEVFIKHNSDIGDVVLDPFMGSGSTGVAALSTNRNFIDIELDEGYFEIARNRIEEAANKTK